MPEPVEIPVKADFSQAEAQYRQFVEQVSGRAVTTRAEMAGMDKGERHVESMRMRDANRQYQGGQSRRERDEGYIARMEERDRRTAERERDRGQARQERDEGWLDQQEVRHRRDSERQREQSVHRDSAMLLGAAYGGLRAATGSYQAYTAQRDASLAQAMALTPSASLQASQQQLEAGFSGVRNMFGLTEAVHSLVGGSEYGAQGVREQLRVATMRTESVDRIFQQVEQTTRESRVRAGYGRQGALGMNVSDIQEQARIEQAGLSKQASDLRNQNANRKAAPGTGGYKLTALGAIYVPQETQAEYDAANQREMEATGHDIRREARGKRAEFDVARAKLHSGFERQQYELQRQQAAEGATGRYGRAFELEKLHEQNVLAERQAHDDHAPNVDALRRRNRATEEEALFRATREQRIEQAALTGGVTSAALRGGRRFFEAEIEEAKTQRYIEHEQADPASKQLAWERGVARIEEIQARQKQDVMMFGVTQQSAAARAQIHMTRDPLASARAGVWSPAIAQMMNLPQGPEGKRMADALMGRAAAEEAAVTRDYAVRATQREQHLYLQRDVTGMQAQGFGPDATYYLRKAHVMQIGGSAELRAQSQLAQDSSERGMRAANLERQIGMNELRREQANFMNSFRASPVDPTHDYLGSIGRSGGPEEVMGELLAEMKTLNGKIDRALQVTE